MENIPVLPYEEISWCIVLPRRQPPMHPAPATVAPQCCLGSAPPLSAGLVNDSKSRRGTAEYESVSSKVELKPVNPSDLSQYCDTTPPAPGDRAESVRLRFPWAAWQSRNMDPARTRRLPIGPRLGQSAALKEDVP
jgi:hypothetical protein